MVKAKVIFKCNHIILDINNKDIRDANNTYADSDDEGESMDW